jgi:hypothetical protein
MGHPLPRNSPQRCQILMLEILLKRSSYHFSRRYPSMKILMSLSMQTRGEKQLSNVC